MIDGQPSDGHSRRVIVSEMAVWQLVEERAIILNLDNEQYYRLDAVGSRMWEALDELGDIDRVHALLCDEYDVDAGQLRSDLEQLVSELVAAGLVHVKPVGE